MTDKQMIGALRRELLKRMPEAPRDHEWGPAFHHCYWCECILDYDANTGAIGAVPPEHHKPNCFAVKYLGRPT